MPTAPEPASVMVGLLLLGALALLWLLPGFIASKRHHHQRTAIWVLTLLGGWSGLGWLVALVWSCTAVDHSRAPYDPYAMPRS